PAAVLHAAWANRRVDILQHMRVDPAEDHAAFWPLRQAVVRVAPDPSGAPLRPRKNDFVPHRAFRAVRQRKKVFSLWQIEVGLHLLHSCRKLNWLYEVVDKAQHIDPSKRSECRLFGWGSDPAHWCLLAPDKRLGY